MKRLLHGLARPSTFIPAIVILLFAFLGASQLIPQNTLAILINGVFISVCVMIFAAYGPTLLRSLRADHERKEQHLVTGILMMWGAIAASRMWSLALIMAGKPPWMINHWFQTFCYVVAAASGYYYLTISGGTSKVGYRYATVAAIAAVLGTTIILAFFET